MIAYRIDIDSFARKSKRSSRRKRRIISSFHIGYYCRSRICFKIGSFQIAESSILGYRGRSIKASASNRKNKSRSCSRCGSFYISIDMLGISHICRYCSICVKRIGRSSTISICPNNSIPWGITTTLKRVIPIKNCGTRFKNINIPITRLLSKNNK